MQIGKNTFWKSCWIMGGLIFSMARAGIAAEAHVTASLQSPEMTLGEVTELNLVVEGSASASDPQFPEVDGLDITHVGQSTNLQFINGSMSGGVTHIYQIIPQRAGVFTIPEILIRVGRETLKTQPLKLKVLKPASSFSVPSSSTPPSSGNAATSSSTSKGGQEAAMIQLLFPKRDFFVGEMIPTDLKVYLRQGLQISEISMPTLTGKAFTVGKLGNQPEKINETIDGIPYIVFTWHTSIAAIKSGDQPLGAQIECTVLVSDSSRRRSSPFGGGMFDDPFFDNFFGNVQQKKVTLQTQDATVKVLNVPEDGKPSDFSGAIGRFQITASATPTEITEGDPVTIKGIISGSGNFDRVRPPEIEKSNSFKTYSPNSKFDPEDEKGFVGQKTFEQMVIPQSSDIKAIPSLHFSFFDPEARKYTTLTTEAFPIKITPAKTESSSASISHSSSGSALSTQNQKSLITQTGHAELVPNKLESGSVSHDFASSLSSPIYWSLVSIPSIGLILVWGQARRQMRMIHDPAFARNLSANRAIRLQLEAMDLALKKKDPVEFFSASRRVLQERLGERWGINPETITLSEIETRLVQYPEQIHDLRKIFETADAISYSGQTFSAESLLEWKKAVLTMLKKLEQIR